MAAITDLNALPSDVLIQKIMIPLLQGDNAVEAYATFLTIDKRFKSHCKTRVIRNRINLTRHLVFDIGKPTGYVNFMLKCADANNNHASLLYGMSMCLCFDQTKVGIKYLEKIKGESMIANYVWSVFKMHETSTELEGMYALNSLRLNSTEDFIDKLRMSTLRMLPPALQFSSYLKELHFYCVMGDKCNKRHRSNDEPLNSSYNFTCADKYAMTLEYNTFSSAIVQRKQSKR